MVRLSPTALVPGLFAMDPGGSRRVLVRFTGEAVWCPADHRRLQLDMAGADMSFINSGRAPVLVDHYVDTASLVGVVERAWIEGRDALAELRFGRSTLANETWANVEAGVLRNVSMGAWHSHAEEEGEQVIRHWWPYEVSFVAVPGDVNSRSLILRPDAMDVEEESLRRLLAQRIAPGAA